jgi:hypothetical protein
MEEEEHAMRLRRRSHWSIVIAGSEEATEKEGQHAGWAECVMDEPEARKGRGGFETE